MKNGSKIKFSGEADEIPGTIPGDVIIIVSEKEHDIFKRKGSELVMDIDLTLTEALTGRCVYVYIYVGVSVYVRRCIYMYVLV